MTRKRIIVEIGMGNDLYGEDYTKAAVRAVQDALHHSSLTIFKSLEIDPNSMSVVVTIGVQKPEKIDHNTVSAQIPYGTVLVKPIIGGLDIPDPENDIVTVVATAAIAADIEVAEKRVAMK